MNEIPLGLAFANYLSNPCEATVEGVLMAMDGRKDLPINTEQTRQALIDGIPQVQAHINGGPAGQTGALLQRLMAGKQK